MTVLVEKIQFIQIIICFEINKGLYFKEIKQRRSAFSCIFYLDYLKIEKKKNKKKKEEEQKERIKTTKLIQTN